MVADNFITKSQGILKTGFDRPAAPTDVPVADLSMTLTLWRVGVGPSAVSTGRRVQSRRDFDRSADGGVACKSLRTP